MDQSAASGSEPSPIDWSRLLRRAAYSLFAEAVGVHACRSERVRRGQERQLRPRQAGLERSAPSPVSGGGAARRRRTPGRATGRALISAGAGHHAAAGSSRGSGRSDSSRECGRQRVAARADTSRSPARRRASRFRRFGARLDCVWPSYEGAGDEQRHARRIAARTSIAANRREPPHREREPHPRVRASKRNEKQQRSSRWRPAGEQQKQCRSTRAR